MFLNEPADDETVHRLYAEDEAEEGYVMNLTRLWAWRPEVARAFGEARRNLSAGTCLGSREWAVLACSAVRTLGDSYCALAWGGRLARDVGAEAAAALLETGETGALTGREAALSRWANLVATDPNATTQEDVDDLRAAGFGDREIFEATVWIAFRIAFATVNDALGVQPDARVAAAVPDPVRAAVDFGRPAEAAVAG